MDMPLEDAMKLPVAVLALAVAAGPDGIVTDMTPALLEQAIQQGRVKAPSGLLGGLFGKVSLPGQYPQGGRRKPCFLMTPYSRVVFASHLAFEQNLALTPEGVDRNLLAPELWVVCSPITRGSEPASDVRTIALVAGDRAVPATRTEVSRELYRDRFGFTYPALGMTAVFPLDGARPGGEISVIYSDGDDARIKLDLTGVR
jgi:hypothetical protein